MANKPFVSQDGYSIGDTPVNIILANGDITTTRITLSNDATSTSGAVVLTGDPNPISGNVGVLQIGPPLGFDDTDIVVSMSHSANGYTQVILQNPDPGTLASADFVVNNDRSTGAGIYGDFGINSSNYAGGDAFGIADGVYLLASNATMSVGTLTEHPLNLATNNVTRMTVASISGNITVTGNLAVGNLDMTAKANLGAVGNVAITGGSANYTLETNGSGVLSWVAPVTASSLSGTTLNSSIVTSSLTTVGTLGSLTVTGNISSGNANLGNLATANFFQGDGGLLSNITATGGTSIVNGTSNVVVVASGNVTTSVAGTANVLLVKATGANILGTLDVTGLATIGNLFFTNPGIGNSTVVTFDKTTDYAGFLVSEWDTNNTLYEFYLGDDAFDAFGTGGDFFSWRLAQWTSPNHVWQPLFIGAGNSRYVASEHVYYGKITQTVGPAFSTGNTGGVGASVSNQVFNDVTKLKTVSSSALTITVLNVSGCTDGLVRPWITITGSGTTFDWGYNSYLDTPVQTGLTVSTSPVTLSNGILVTFSGTTGAAGDRFAFTYYPAPNNTFGNTAITGNLSATTTISATGNVSGGNLTTGGQVVATGNITGGNLIGPHANGNSNVNIATANGNITLSAVGNANVVVVTGTGANVAGTLSVSGTTNLGSVGNVTITGGSNGYLLSTNGSGALSWVASATSSNIVLNTFTGNGVQTVFTLTNSPTSEDYTIINIDGVSQLHSAYTVANANVTLSSAPVNGAAIEVMTFNLGGAGSNASSGYTYVEATGNTNAAANTKYIVNTNSANLTITLPSSPSFGDEVGIIDGTGNASVHAITVGRNGGNIQGAASNMTVTTDRSAFTLVYYNASQGWILTNI